MNKNYEKFLEILLKNRQVPLQGEINEESFKLINHSLMYLNAKNPKGEIELLIGSGGGNVGYGLAIYDAITTSSSPVVGIVKGFAHSMAAVILQGCIKRKATLHSKLCIHNMEASSQIYLTFENKTNPYGDLDIDKVVYSLKRSVEDMRSICKIFSLRTGLDATDIGKMLESGEIISAQTALDIGLIDEII